MASASLVATRHRSDRTPRYGGTQGLPPRRRVHVSPVLVQALLVAALVLSSFAVSFASGIGSRFYYMGVSLFLAIYYLRASPWLYITMTLWSWTLTSFVRRLTEYHSGFDPKDFILGTPELLCLLMMWSIVNNREILKLRESIIGLFVLLPIFFGVAVSFVAGNVIGGIAASADWISPILYYFFVIGNWRTARGADSTLREFFIINAVVVCGYSLYQFVAAPPWDVQWLLGSGMVGMGKPFPFEIRIFSVFSTPGPLAAWLALLIMVFLHYRSKVRPIIVPLLAVLIVMTTVRSVAGAVVLCLPLAAVMGQKGIGKLMIIGSVGLVIGVSIVSITVPDVGDVIQKRIMSVEDLQTDASAQERSVIWETSPKLINDNPFGVGIGATGRGAVANDSRENQIIDSGPLSIYLALGWVGGSFYLIGMVLILVQSWLATRATRSTAAIAFTCAAISQFALLPFSNVLGTTGLSIFFCSGYAAALAIEANNARQVLTRPIDRFETRRLPREIQA